MKQLLYRAVMATILLALITGLFYPLVVTGISQLAFKNTANGSLIKKGNRVVGSRLIGQNFTKPEYFHPRPSAAGKNNGYDATASTGTNLGPTNKKLVQNIQANISKVLAENPGITKNQIPVDLVTSSASGLDPHISPAAAQIQVPRVAKARNLDEATVKKLVDKNTEGRQLGVFGEPRVNVLMLNLALDNIKR